MRKLYFRQPCISILQDTSSRVALQYVMVSQLEYLGRGKVQPYPLIFGKKTGYTEVNMPIEEGSAFFQDGFGGVQKVERQSNKRRRIWVEYTITRVHVGVRALAVSVRKIFRVIKNADFCPFRPFLLVAKNFLEHSHKPSMYYFWCPSTNPPRWVLSRMERRNIKKPLWCRQQKIKINIFFQSLIWWPRTGPNVLPSSTN